MKKTYETFGNYILLEKLAAGGMAEVYLAKKMAVSGVQKFVAVKRILQQFSDSEDFIAMFKDEAKIAINLAHSNVVSIYDFGTENNQFYIVMEFVEGRNLRQILNRMKRLEKQFSVAQVAHIIKQVAAGLDHAHRCIDPTTGQPLNIIHRDMSPQNVMLSFEGEAKVVDFGIAKAAHQLESTRAGTLKGKFGYMSPEQVEGHTIDSRTDIFAIGIMIWEMLANQRLFLANSEINTLRKIRECDVPSLRKINPNIPSELDQIVLKALEKDKLERYQSAADLHRDLQGFISRYDPDFSVQDLSQFVKILFSEEIIQTRKKQMIYAQVSASKLEDSENTEVVQTTSSSVRRDEMSLDQLSISKSRSRTENSSVTMRRAAGDVDFSTAVVEDGKTQARALHIAKRDAHETAREYKKNTYTNTNPLTTGENRNKNATLLTVIFSMCFLLMFFAYLNKFHPGFKNSFCKSMESYGLCPRSIYIPTNLLEITANPTGAEIYVNGEKVGEAPTELLVKKLPLQIAIRMAGYKTINEKMTEVPSTNKMDFTLVPLPSGYLRVKSAGVEIYVDGVIVKSGQNFAIPANKSVSVKVINPITGQSREEFHSVKVNERKSIFVDPPSGNE